jgi:hypothetical protein
MPVRREQVAAALKYLGDKADVKRRYERLTSLDQPQDSDAIDMALEMGGSLVPGVGQVLAARDFERARRADDEAGMAMAGASALPLGRLAGALKQYDPTMQKIFIGKSAKTWDAAAAKRAEEMEAAGADPETIWRETGTYRGTDDQLRQEIPDEMAFKPGYGLPGGRSRAYNVNEAVFNPAMRAAYPDIMEETLTTMRVKPDVPETGYFQERVPATRETFGLDPEIGVSGRNRPEIKSVLAHELQHAVQAKEKFARGGNPDQFKIMSAGEREETINRLRRKIGQMAADRHKDGEFIISGFERAKPETLADPEIRDMMYELKRVETMADPREQYKRLAGEAEARAVQARLGMTKEQRRQTYPFKSYDVPVNELINRK